MTVFVDTSALYAVLDRSDRNNSRAGGVWVRLVRESANILTTNYVVVETSALLQHRLGVPALRAFYEDMYPQLTLSWISEGQHTASVEAVLAAGRKRLSLVDCSSFQTMRQCGVRVAFAFDDHFREQGFEVLP